MLKNEPKQLSLYSILYNKIPENHILKRINNAVDFSFINKLLESSYCKFYGRPAKEPEMMSKLLILQYLYNLSDEKVIEDTRINLAYMWFIGVNPEDDLPNPSLLAKFRTQRLKEIMLDDIIKEVIRQCVEKGIIKGTGMTVDCTHAQANTGKLTPERIMKHLAKKIIKNLKEEKGMIPDNINTDIPNYKEIEDPKQAKGTMKNYLEKLIDDTKAAVESTEESNTRKVLDKAKEILRDPKFLEQKGIRSLVDEDARVGHKTKTETFFGYKIEFAMVPEERIITAVTVGNGAYVDGTEFEKLYNMTKECGIDIRDVYGDKAYFRKPILDVLKERHVNAYIPVSESAYKIDDSKYSYNKDSDQWFCNEGNYTIKKRRPKKKNRNSVIYYFDKEGCKNCPKRKGCIKGKTIAKSMEISVNTPELYEHSQWAKTEEFKEKYKKRASHEWKNGEMKRFHGMDRARGYGLRSMRTQAKLTALAVNLKRIANMVSSFSDTISYFLEKLPVLSG
ncbi:MAG TPA: IS1182 family transposase [Bacillota bacterium]|nr:IS1182 family transposase [Petrotogaceae bacterium]HQI16803.1 IS1182 family transposase [Bacillota bacterium]